LFSQQHDIAHDVQSSNIWRNIFLTDASENIALNTLTCTTRPVLFASNIVSIVAIFF
jgi:hypothetical protein